MIKTVWKDLPSKETPVTASELNRLENNIIENSKFRETYINGKTGYITKEDILALGIPVEDGRYVDIDVIFIGKNNQEEVADIIL